MLATTFACPLLFFIQLGAATRIVPAAGCPTCQEQKCDGHDNCLHGCITGFAGRKCVHQCPPNCMDSICYYDDDKGTYPCSMGCSPGYYGFQCNTPCQSLDKDGSCDRFSGTTPDCGGHSYGEKCETSCQVKCGGFPCDNKEECFKEVCKAGRFGSDCGKPCGDDCEGCHRDTGQCLKRKSKRFKDEAGSTLETNGNCGYWTKTCCVLTLICLCMIAAAGWIIVYQNNTFFKSTSAIRIKSGDEMVIIHPREGVHPELRKRHNASSPEEVELLDKSQ